MTWHGAEARASWADRVFGRSRYSVTNHSGRWFYGRTFEEAQRKADADTRRWDAGW